MRRRVCVKSTNWISTDIFPSIDKYELEAKRWVYLWKQTGPYISLGITEISCINTGPPTAASHLKWETIGPENCPPSASEQTWGTAVVIRLSGILSWSGFDTKDIWFNEQSHLDTTVNSRRMFRRNTNTKSTNRRSWTALYGCSDLMAVLC